MLAKSVTKYIHRTARKGRLVADLIRGKRVNQAMAMLENLNKGSATDVKRALKSAIDNFKNKHEKKLGLDNIIVSRILIDEGPMFKRFKAGPMGRAMGIRKKTSHITIELDERK